MRAVEKIDSIKIFDAGGMMNGAGNGAASTSLGDSLSGHLLRYQYNSPILGALLKEAGLQGGANPIDALVDGVREGNGAPPSPALAGGDTIDSIKASASWPKPGGELNPRA